MQHIIAQFRLKARSDPLRCTCQVINLASHNLLRDLVAALVCLHHLLWPLLATIYMCYP